LFSVKSGNQSDSKKHQTVPYGIHPLKNAAIAEAPAPLPLTPLNDRVLNAEAMVLGFAAENSLPFSIVPGVINLAKALASDSKALSSMHINRTTASYKTQFGIGKTSAEHLVDILKRTPFSFNIDESTSSNYHKVLTILVSYFCPLRSRVVVHHFASLSCIKVNSESLYNEVVRLMEDSAISWRNLMSVLMDSCNVMRGSKSGL
jgi:hypothetical protein